MIFGNSIITMKDSSISIWADSLFFNGVNFNQEIDLLKFNNQILIELYRQMETVLIAQGSCLKYRSYRKYKKCLGK